MMKRLTLLLLALAFASQGWGQGLQMDRIRPAGINGIVYVDGRAYTTVQAAINSLNGNGGTVYVPCGTYAGPTSIPSFTHVVSTCGPKPLSAALIGNGTGVIGAWASASHAPSSTSGQTIFTYTTSTILLNEVYGVEIAGIVFDFGGNNAGLVFKGTVGGTFDIVVQNCAGVNVTPCFQVQGVDNGAMDYFASVENDFRRIVINSVPYGGTPGGIGMYLQGSIGGNYINDRGHVTNNHFGFLSIYNVQYGIQFAGGDDSNHFNHVYVNVNPQNAGQGNAIAANCGNASPEGDDGESFDTLEVDYNGTPTTGNAICLGKLDGFRVSNFEVGGLWGTHELTTTGSPTYSLHRSLDIPTPANNNSTQQTGPFIFANDVTLSNAPRFVWHTFVPSVGNTSSTIQNFFIAEKALTITRITAFVTGTNSAGCSTSPTFFVRDATAATSSTTAVIPNATNNVDSGAFAFNVASGDQLQLQYTAAGCGTAATNVNVMVQYRMQ